MSTLESKIIVASFTKSTVLTTYLDVEELSAYTTLSSDAPDFTYMQVTGALCKHHISTFMERLIFL